MEDRVMGSIQMTNYDILARMIDRAFNDEYAEPEILKERQSDLVPRMQQVVGLLKQAEKMVSESAG